MKKGAAFHDFYLSPLGKISLASDGSNLTGLWFENQKYYPAELGKKADIDIFGTAKKWLDIYFSGKEPAFMPPVAFEGTEFQKEVWRALTEIPYGQVTTYGAIAKKMEAERGGRISARAVGSAVGRNPISVIVPCHRVVGANGKLTGYAGGLDRKMWLLESERAD